MLLHRLQLVQGGEYWQAKGVRKTWIGRNGPKGVYRNLLRHGGSLLTLKWPGVETLTCINSTAATLLLKDSLIETLQTARKKLNCLLLKFQNVLL